MRNLLIFAFVMGLSACASVLEDRNQQITVSSTPAGATCKLIREGEQIGAVESTPNVVVVERNEQDITVICSKDGWGEGAEVLVASVADRDSLARYVNAYLSIGIGVLIDQATGALYRYPPSIMVSLPPLD